MTPPFQWKALAQTTPIHPLPLNNQCKEYPITKVTALQSQKIGVYTSAHDKLLPEESTYIPPTPTFHKTSFPTRHELQIHINTTSADFNPNSLNYKTISQIPPLPQNKSTLAKAN